LHLDSLEQFLETASFAFLFIPSKSMQVQGKVICTLLNATSHCLLMPSTGIPHRDPKAWKM
jgi:hypothetical protein